jgi:hypothetical protein
MSHTVMAVQHGNSMAAGLSQQSGKAFIGGRKLLISIAS